MNHSPIVNAKDIDVVMSTYSLIEYSDNYWKTSGNLWQYYRDEPSLTNAGVIDDFFGSSALIKFKQKITGKTKHNVTKNVDIIVPLKYLSNFWRTLEMPLTDCKINLILTWSDNYVLSDTNAN